MKQKLKTIVIIIIVFFMVMFLFSWLNGISGNTEIEFSTYQKLSKMKKFPEMQQMFKEASADGTINRLEYRRLNNKYKELEKDFVMNLLTRE